MKITAVKHYFVLSCFILGTDFITIFQEMYKTHVAQYNFLRLKVLSDEN
jgi:hypothetical protein